MNKAIALPALRPNHGNEMTCELWWPILFAAMTHRTLLHLSVIATGLLHHDVLKAAELQLPRARGFPRAAVIDEKIYLFGGRSDLVDILNPEQGQWTSARLEMPISPTLLGDQLDGQLYLFAPSSKKFIRFDPETGKSHQLPDIPTRSVNSTAIGVDGKLYVIGGYTPDVNAANSVQVFDPKTNRWSNGPPLPNYQPLDHFHSAAVLGGKLHVVGGLLKNQGQPHWRLDGDRWTPLAEPPVDTMWKHMVLVAAAGRLYLISPLADATSRNESNDIDNIYTYIPQADQWESAGKVPKGFPIGLFAEAVVKDKIYVLGGVASNVVRVYDVANKKWD